jgi:hydrogenase maturation factor HypF (carbamoyltransferase family)
MTKPTTVAVTLDPESYAIFKEAVELTAKAGAEVTVSQLLQQHLQDEIPKESPRRIAQNYLKSVVRQIKEISPGSRKDQGETPGRTG